mgnify:CR=1 FL=1
MKKIPYGKQLIDREDKKFVLDSLSKDLITTGPYVQRFENSITKFFKSKFSYVCSSGTSALHLAMLSINLKPNDTILMPSVNFIASYNEMKGIASATVVTATALTGDVLATMKSYVSTLLGKTDIDLTNDVDPTIIGGIIIKHEDKLLDKSVSKELREIRKQLIYN